MQALLLVKSRKGSASSTNKRAASNENKKATKNEESKISSISVSARSGGDDGDKI